MMRQLAVLSCGPACTVQDTGRPGFLAQGVARGGAADRLALAEGAALLGQTTDHAALEMAGSGGTFEASGPLRIALTGAPMAASIDGTAIAWNASHHLPAGGILVIGGARSGTYGYLHVGGGIDTPRMMGARAVHVGAGLGRPLHAGDTLPIGDDQGTGTGMALRPDTRFEGGDIRIIASLQTAMFDEKTRSAFAETTFVRDARANRMGVRLDGGRGFFAADQLNILSEIIVPGDIQIAGDGAPYILMADCQTTGGYPRIATVLPCDLDRVAQTPAGAALRLRFVDLDTAADIENRAAAARAALPTQLYPLVRKPDDMRDLLSHEFIGGVVSATADPFEKD
ncbi:biotin-dependent carboxyltransferase family protein [Sulfitobacter sp. S190]|uniref:5-oxoprolinase subunit C family protein n=1 Tax=Sulfitobacter sp. S190 TaxID=2867022 RepID=UPI0021A84D29|nr:biotin-dependent carboxyltransferase family protein [Sulfitobacter sp. S190]UWR22602.1 biotin-dependent carboxyltransferase family protein [Sulfitobacter sp. S190]